MKKQIFKYMILGFVLGIFFSYTISIGISFFHLGTGEFNAATPMFVERIGNEIWAVFYQYLLSGVLGAICAAASLIYRHEKWSYTLQTALHFVLMASAILGIGYVLGWIGESTKEILIYIGIMLASYISVWVGLTFYYRKKVENINAALKK